MPVVGQCEEPQHLSCLMPDGPLERLVAQDDQLLERADEPPLGGQFSTQSLDGADAADLVGSVSRQPLELDLVVVQPGQKEPDEILGGGLNGRK